MSSSPERVQKTKAVSEVALQSCCLNIHGWQAGVEGVAVGGAAPRDSIIHSPFDEKPLINNDDSLTFPINHHLKYSLTSTSGVPN